MKSRRWSRSSGTRDTLLRAAREVFLAKGYAEATVADIVEASGISVGSLYHHFGGKPGLFLALWERFMRGQEEHTSKAAKAAEGTGERFLAGARAYLEGSWEQREVARLFLENDGPTEFVTLRRQRGWDWIGGNKRLLGLADTRESHVLVVLLTTMMGEAGREVAACETGEDARVTIDEVIRLVRRLLPTPDGVAGPTP
ncbi:TetR/AcrR family transcriptional regulator [Nonomuraea sp. KC401]|uniref:TetR/AcrR family transcriptional regulator n=1 Tax=unclassified Nonomuraea TaxID=2593643 RepID=UPI0010FDEEB4|nr:MULTISPECIES: TetR/AcrR family transcriptional regulator [unclassified Nonomuraea]NBE98803.1 TetR family transcriptional regulator [Nonomuraea sp. K271]TLF68679.1 TetR/AcrR family transcriptional regulator [Nonomuraea sp. KC401]